MSNRFSSARTSLRADEAQIGDAEFRHQPGQGGMIGFLVGKDLADDNNMNRTVEAPQPRRRPDQRLQPLDRGHVRHGAHHHRVVPGGDQLFVTRVVQARVESHRVHRRRDHAFGL
jgi:hypothetical protein